MKKSGETTQKIRSSIRKYYQDQKAIKLQQNRLVRLEMRLKNIADDINNPDLNFHLRTSLPGITYDRINVTGGHLPSSSMEQGIEQIYSALEKNYVMTQGEIFETKNLMQKLERDNSRMDFCIGMLNAESRRLLELKYIEHKSIVQIADLMKLSETSVNRNLKMIFCDIEKLNSYLESVAEK